MEKSAPSFFFIPNMAKLIKLKENTWIAKDKVVYIKAFEGGSIITFLNGITVKTANSPDAIVNSFQ